MLKEKRFDAAHGDEQQSAHNKNIGRDGKDRARLAHAAQVDDSDHYYQYNIDGYNGQCRRQCREKRSERQHPSSHTNRDGEHIVDHQGSSSNEAR